MSPRLKTTGLTNRNLFQEFSSRSRKKHSTIFVPIRFLASDCVFYNETQQANYKELELGSPLILYCQSVEPWTAPWIPEYFSFVFQDIEEIQVDVKDGFI